MKELSEETRRFVEAHRGEDVRALALQAGKYPGVDMPEAVVQIAGWQIARKKIPSWADVPGLFYPKHLSMEQCSSELTARYKASLAEGDSFADLTAGFGVDFSFIARRFRQADCYNGRPLCLLKDCGGLQQTLYLLHYSLYPGQLPQRSDGGFAFPGEGACRRRRKGAYFGGAGDNALRR